VFAPFTGVYLLALFRQRSDMWLGCEKGEIIMRFSVLWMILFVLVLACHQSPAAAYEDPRAKTTSSPCAKKLYLKDGSVLEVKAVWLQLGWCEIENPKVHYHKGGGINTISFSKVDIEKTFGEDVCTEYRECKADRIRAAEEERLRKERLRQKRYVPYVPEKPKEVEHETKPSKKYRVTDY
jgi:hypothetical protein